MNHPLATAVFSCLLALFVHGSAIAQTPPSDVAPGYALETDGVDDFATVPHDPMFNAFPMTLTSWVKSTQTNGSKLVVFQRGGYRLTLQDGRAYGFLSKGIAPHPVAVMDPEVLAADGAWHHLGLVADTNGVRLFVDGNLRDSRSWLGGVFGQPPVAEPLFLGGNPANTNGFFAGLLDETTLWNRALSQAELRAVMNRRVPGTEPGLVACWRMDNGTGPVLEDASTNHFDGYLTNAHVWVKSCVPAALGALSLGGPDEHLRIPNFGPAAPTNEITVEFWAKVDAPGTLFTLTPDSPVNRMSAALLVNGAIRWEFGNPQDGGVLEYLPPAPATESWQHFALVASRAGNFMRIYRNGELEAEQRRASVRLAEEADLVIAGARAQVGEFRIWKVARGPDEIRENLHRRLDSAAAGLELYLRFDERAGGIAADQTAQRHDGWLSEQATWAGFPVSFKPSVTALPVSDVDLSSATLNGRINPNGLLTSAWFEWGTDLELQSPVVDMGLGSTFLPFRMPLTGLVAGTTYQYRLVCSNSAGLTFGPAGWFVAALPPIVDTLPATGTRAEYAETRTTLHGSVIPNWSPTAAWFIWGPDVLCLNATAPVSVGSGTNEIRITAALEGLPAEGIYHYRLVASNTVGVVVGPEKTFWAPGIRLNGPRVMKIQPRSVFHDPGASVLRPIVALAGGSYHCLALTYDGRVIAWGAGLTNSGFPNFGQSIVPSGLDGVVAIAAGGEHSLALRNNGRVVAWGKYNQSAVPSTVTNAVAIGAGILLSAAVNADGTAEAWGTFVVVGGGDPSPELSDVVAVDAGLDMVIYLRRDGTVAYETSIFGGPWLTNAVAIDAHHYVNMVLHWNGTVTLWGNGAGAQPAGLTNLIAIANGEYQYLGLKSDGALVGWGCDGAELATPAALSNVVAVAAIYRTNYVLQVNGVVTEWGPFSDRNEVVTTNLAPLAGPVSVSGSVDTTNPGLYILTYTAANPWGTLGTATRAVMVEGSPPAARQIKSNILESLLRTLPQVPNPEVRELLLSARQHLADSLNPTFWADVSLLMRQHGARVFELERAALLELQNVLDHGQSGIPEEEVREWITGILQADRSLAVCAIQDAVHEDSEPRLVSRAWQLVLDGDGAISDQNLGAAVDYYRNAWHQSALLSLRVAVESVTSGLRLMFPSVPALGFEVETSTNLTDWTLVGNGSAGPDGMAVFEHPTRLPGDRLFFRVKVSAP